MFVALAAAALAQPSVPSIVPRPLKMTVAKGAFGLRPDTRIFAPGASRGLATSLQESIGPGTGLPLPISDKAGANSIALMVDPKLVALGPEGYHLTVKADRVEITGAAPAGVFYGIQTLRQLLPVSTFRKARTQTGKLTLPLVDVVDKPRFGWRGALVDTSRHFMPKADILRFLDGLALHKLNTFHFHLTDDQGWRMEVKKYPRLTQIGAWHKANKLTNDPTTWETVPDGGFYTQEDLREIVAYAKARFITVVPEIEMPGHSFAVVVAYPELGNYNKQFTLRGVNDGSDDIVNVSPRVVSFFQDVLREVMEVFPSKFIHVGGDEVWKGHWKANPAMQAQMKQLGLKNEEELQSWFITQMDTFLTKNGRRLVGWDEILEGGLAPGATVMSWRGIDGGIAAAKSGHDVVMSPTSHLYLDYYQSPDRSTEPQAIGGLVTLAKTYSFEPIPASLNASEAKHVLGAQGNMWAEYIPNMDHLEYMAYPRLCALAELTWSPKEGKDFADFTNRLATHLQRLKALDIAYRPLSGPEPGLIGGWKSGEIGEEFTTREWDVAKYVKEAGSYSVRFQYTDGGCRLDIGAVTLLVNGTPVSTDEHEGRTGAVDKDNVYTVQLSELPAGAKVTLRAQVRVDGGTDSAGEIRIKKN